jgi:hypothetical protein
MIIYLFIRIDFVYVLGVMMVTPPPGGTQNQLDAAEELFQPEATDDTLWEIISFDYL